MRHAKCIRGDSLCAMLKELGGLFVCHAKCIRGGLFLRHAKSIRGYSLCAMLKVLEGALYVPC